MLAFLLSGTLQVLAQFATPDNVCIGTTRTYWVVGLSGSNYTWRIDGTIQSSITDSLKVFWEKAGTFTLEVQEHQENCNGDIQTVVVTVSDLPDVFAGSPVSICPGSTIELLNASAAHFSSVHWTSSGDGTFNWPNILKPIYSPGPNDLISGKAILILTAKGLGDSTSCSPAIDSLKLHIISPELLKSTTDQTLCASLLPFKWNGKDYKTTGTYKDTLKSLAGCDSIATLNLKIFDPTTPIFTQIGPLCLNSAAPILPLSSTNSPAITGTWKPAVITTTTSGMTTYTFTADAGQCASNTTMIISIEAPVVPIASVTQPDCNLATGTINVTTPAPGEGILYTVTGTSPVVATVTNSTGVFSGLTSGIYDLTTTSSAGCISKAISLTINIQPVTPDDPIASFTQPDCYLATGSITVTTPAPGIGISYTVTGTSPVVAAVSNATGVFNGLTSGIYDLTTTNAAGCVSKATSQTINIQPPTPAVPVANVIQPTCDVATGMITVTTPVPGSGNSYTVTGTNPVVAVITNSTGVFPGLIPGVYDVITTNAAGCTSQALSLTINVQPITPNDPTASVTQPDCTFSMGTIMIDTPAPEDGISYTVTGTDPAVASVNNTTGHFDGLIPGIYAVTTTNAVGCTSKAISLTINKQPVIPADPTASVTQPDCFTATGAITVTVPAPGIGISYTLTGTDPAVVSVNNTTGLFAGLMPGIYEVITTNEVGCTSKALSITITDQPSTPAVPIASVTQPTCAVATGVIAVSTPVPGAGNSYTVTGTKPVVAAMTNSTGVFTGLIPGVYDVITTNAAGCISKALSRTINVQSFTPADPVVKVTQPGCTVPTGTMTVITPAPGAGISYTVTGKNPVVAAQTNTTGIFVGLNSGIYDVTTTNASGCISKAISSTVNVQLLTPADPIASVTQPTCTVATGTITVTSPATGAGITYTVTGTNPTVAAKTNATGIFAGLNPGDYDVTTTNVLGCVSKAISRTVNLQPITPDIPTASVTQPTCTVSTGTITVTVPVPDAGISYTVTGINPVVAATSNTTGIFAGLKPGAYEVITTNAVGCTSKALSLTINIQPVTPSSPVATIITPTCALATGTITITTPAPDAGISYTVAGTNPVVSPVNNVTGIFAGLNPGVYDVTTTNATGCISKASSYTINTQTDTPADPVVKITQTTCSVGTGSMTVTTPDLAAGISYTVTGTDPVVAPVKNTTGIFTGLTSGVYDVTTTNALGCISKAISSTINVQPVIPDDPIAKVTQPTFTVATGTITITSPAPGAGNSYTVSGINPVVAAVSNTSGEFSGLKTGVYRVTTTNAAGCISRAIGLAISIQPVRPPDPIATVTQPDCSVSTGTIKVTTPAPGSVILYTIAGVNPVVTATSNSTGVFSGLAPGDYDVTSTNAAGYISASTRYTINIPPVTPADPVIQVTQPTFTVATGSITVTSPEPAAGLSYTITGINLVFGPVTNITGEFTGLKSGLYSISTKNGTECPSQAILRTIINQPVKPSDPVAKATQPTCAVATGTITVTSPAPAPGITFIVTGTNPILASVKNTTGVFKGLGSGDFDVTVSNVDGFVSNPINITIKNQPFTPATPVATVTKTTCINPFGTINIESPLPEPGLTYTITGTNPVTVSSTNSTGKFSGLKLGVYDLTTMSSTGCNSAPLSLVVAVPIVAVPVATVEQPTCSVATGSVSVTAPIPGDGISYTIYGINPVVAPITNATGKFTGLTAGDYGLTTTTAIDGCTSDATKIKINVQPVIPAIPEASVSIQPSCTVAFGTIIVTKPVPGAGISYTLTGTNPVAAPVTNESGIFTGLKSGDYDMTTTNVAGCTSGALSLTVNVRPDVPGDPVTSVLQTKCDVATGSITVNSPVPGPGIIYVLKGINPMVDPVSNETGSFTDVEPGIYEVYTSNSVGCLSISVSDTINLQPVTPADPTATLTQPNCTNATGTVTVNTPAPAKGISYTLMGTNPVVAATSNKTGVFSGLTTGVYKLTTTNAGGCTSNAITLTVNTQPVTPAKPNARLIMPTCDIATGTITINTPSPGVGISYTVTGTDPVVAPVTNSTGLFVKVTPGVYDVTTTNAVGCTSIAISRTIDMQPVTPAIPITSVTQPDCDVATGMITVNTPAPGPGILYTLSGTNPVIAPVTNGAGIFTELTPGAYEVTTTNAFGCTSDAQTDTVNIQPVTPAPPKVRVTFSPTCNNPDGTVEIYYPTQGTGFEYSINGGPYQASAVFDTLRTDRYVFKVRNAITGCESDTISLKVPAIPPSPTLAISAFENSKCFGTNGSISFDVTNAPDSVYGFNWDGGQFTDVSIIGNKATVVVPPGVYNNIILEVRGCFSAEVVNAVITQPDEIVISESVTEIDFKSNPKGAIALSVSGGTGAFGYKWSNGDTTSVIKNLKEGTYTVDVTDENNCSAQKSIVIPVPNYPPVAVDDKFDAGCNGVEGILTSNDSDKEGDPFFMDQTPVVDPLHGIVTLNAATGWFKYIANPGFSGKDKFRYAIYDSLKYLGDTATVFINVIPDFDCDGIADSIDADADGDGILNVDEVLKGEDWKTTDSDGDGHPNWLDIDADNDGIVDNIESQSTTGYIAPLGKDTNGDGVDDAYDPENGGTRIIPVDTDGDGVPDFLDSDSDNDGVPDYIEGHDANADGRPDYGQMSGKDSDVDGLDDAFDIVDKYASPGTNMTGSNAPLQDFDGDGIKDWRDDNDDNDQWLTRFEDLNMDGNWSDDDIGHPGQPEYLYFGRDCELFVPEAFSPNNDNVHDYFQIYCMDSYPNAVIYIYDQVGNKVYQKDHYGNVEYWKSAEHAWWDGKTTNRSVASNGGMVPQGTYYYVLVLGNGEVKKSYVFVSY